jgi:hypothetical protein
LHGPIKKEKGKRKKEKGPDAGAKMLDSVDR